MSPQDFAAKWSSAGAAPPTSNAGLAGVIKNLPAAKSKGNIITRNLNTIGQVGGGIGGLLLGGPAGGIAGAAAGGALGEAAKRAALGEKQNLGESLKQAAIGGANELGGQVIGAGFKAAKGASFLDSLLGKTADKVATGAGELGTETASKSATKSAGNTLRSNVMNPLVKASPSGATAEAKIVEEANKLLPTGSATAKYKAMPAIMNDLGTQLETTLGKNTATVPAKSLTDALSTTLKDATNFDTTDSGFIKAVAGHLNNITSAADKAGNLTAKDVAGLRRVVQDAAFKTGASTPRKEAALAVWQHLGDTLTQIAPEAKDIVSKQGTLFKAAPGLKAASKSTMGVPLVGLKSKTAARVVQSGEDVLGKGLQSVSPLTSLLGKVTGSVAPRIAPKVAESIISPTPVDTTSPQPLDTSAIAPDQAGLDVGGSTASPDTSGRVFTPEVLQALAISDLQKTGGKNLGQISTLATLFGPNSKMEQTLTADQQKSVGAVNDASSLLDTMLGQLQATGGGQGRVGGGLAGLLGKVGLNNNVNAYNQTKTDAAITLAKALTGASRVPESVIKSVENSLPSISDNPQEAARKVQLMKQRLEARIAIYKGGSTPSADFTGLPHLSGTP